MHEHTNVDPLREVYDAFAVRYRRLLLTFVLGAIAVTAALGLYAVLVPGEFGETQAKVFATSMAISGASIVTLAFMPAWERRLLGPLPAVGAALALLTLALTLIGMWGEVDSVDFWKLLGTTALLAAWSVLICLLALATLPSRLEWVYLAAAGLTLTLAAIGIGAMWTEPDDGETVARTAAALAVLSAAFVLAVPVLSRASRWELAAADRPPGAGFCPRCGAPVALVATDEPSTCGRCGARFLVSYHSVEESRNAAFEH
jgi:hypothetical protein